MNFENQLQITFEKNRNHQQSILMQKYMRNHFAFLGIKTPLRRTLLKNTWSLHKDEIDLNYRNIAYNLFLKKEREYQYCAIDILTQKMKNNFITADLEFIYWLLSTKSWWDSVDLISKYLLGGYLLRYPSAITNFSPLFSDSSSLWLVRSSILFQLGYKEKTDFELLKRLCLQQKDSTEFFIQKAIGWALREYAKKDPQAVIQFVSQYQLQPLSKKEALKNLTVA